MVSLFFRGVGMTECVRVFQKTPIKITKQNFLQPEQFWGKRRVEKSLPHPNKTLEILDSKTEGYQARPWHNIEVKPAILVRIPPFSLVSPGCCTFVYAYGGIQEGGGPVVLMILLFQKILSTIYVYGDGNTTCILIRNFIKRCYTDQGFGNNFVRLRFDYF